MVGHLPGNVIKLQLDLSSQMEPKLAHTGNTVRKQKEKGEPNLLKDTQGRERITGS